MTQAGLRLRPLCRAAAGVLLGLPLVLGAVPGHAQTVDRAALVAQFCRDAAGMAQAGQSLLALAANGSPGDLAWGAAITDAASTQRLRCSTDAASTVIAGVPTGTVNAVTLAPADAQAGSRAPMLNLRSRSVFETAQAAFQLRTGITEQQRSQALSLLERRAATVPPELFERAAAGEASPALRQAIQDVAQLAALNTPETAKRIPAIEQLASTPTRRVETLLSALKSDKAYASDPAFRAAVDAGLARVQRGVLFGDVLSTIYNGLSFASILLMASIGLAIIFGLMGVINLAQGELIMIGAYVTYLVQELLRAASPGLLDYYLLLAVPIAFLATAAIGIAVEVLLLRHLYRRPLMSLLATWAVSLLLINLVRVMFGTQNLQFATPFYVTGGTPVVGDFIITWNRLFAIVFAAVTLVLTWFVVQRTSLGLNIRAVTQNREMAGCIGIPVRRVDMLAFGLGSGLAGLAGLALSPIYNVNPQMGTNFIIDSFMVVVLGGVGTLLGTVAAALGVGQVNVLIEPLWGAVAAKVIVLCLIIAFLQWKPEGLFATQGKRR